MDVLFISIERKKDIVEGLINFLQFKESSHKVWWQNIWLNQDLDLGKILMSKNNLFFLNIYISILFQS